MRVTGRTATAVLGAALLIGGASGPAAAKEGTSDASSSASSGTWAASGSWRSWGASASSGHADAHCRPEKGYKPLFDGTAKSLAHWKQAGPGSFSLSDDGTLTSSGGLGLLWYSASEFGSYSLKLDWKMSSAGGDDNSGVFVGFPASDDPWSAVDNGYEVQIDASDAPDRTTGAVYSFQSADLDKRDRALNPPGEWNSYEIRVEGERLRVRLNGVQINDYTNTDPARSLRDGHVGIQNHGAEDQVSFRDVRIRQLPVRSTAQGH